MGHQIAFVFKNWNYTSYAYGIALQMQGILMFMGPCLIICKTCKLEAAVKGVWGLFLKGPNISAQQRASGPRAHVYMLRICGPARYSGTTTWYPHNLTRDACAASRSTLATLAVTRGEPGPFGTLPPEAPHGCKAASYACSGP